jgi:hypothetical protein
LLQATKYLSIWKKTLKAIAVTTKEIPSVLIKGFRGKIVSHLFISSIKPAMKNIYKIGKNNDWLFK